MTSKIPAHLLMLQKLSIPLLLALLAVPTEMTQAQPQPDAPRGIPIAVEAVAVFSDTSLSAVINVHYRIPQEFFIFTRRDEGGMFTAEGEVMVELLDAQNTSVDRSIQSIKQVRPAPPADPADLPDIQRAVTLSGPPGSYTVLFTVDDLGSGRSFSNKNLKVEWKRPDSNRAEASFLFFAHPTHEGSSEDSPAYRIFNRGTDVLFGSPKGSGALLEIYAPADTSHVWIEWKLVSSPQRGLAPQEWGGSGDVNYRGVPVLVDTGTGIQYRITNTPGSSWRTVFVPLPLELLMPGKVVLTLAVSKGLQKGSVTTDFRVHWLTEPVSLRDLNLAVDALQFIVPQPGMDTLFSTSQAQRVRNLYRFWRERDPDTTTAYNEAMTEYYRRVDVAIRQYSSTNEMDGYKSDRGRIYILYGSPQSTERLLGPGDVPREVWTYISVKRRFIFSDLRKNGNYILTASENL